MPAEIPHRIFPDPCAIDVDDEFCRTLKHDDARISGAQSNDQLEGSFFDEIIDDPPLDLQRCDLEQERDDRQCHHGNLVRPAHCKNVPKNGIRQRGSYGLHQLRS